MAANIAGLSLRVEGGMDLADRIDPRFVELTLSERREEEADEMSLVLQNHDGLLAVPEEGRALLLSLGWRSGTDVPVGLVDKGRFIVDEVSLQGPPDMVEIRARSADMTGLYRQRRTRSWRGTTLGAIITEIARRHGRTARVAGALASVAVAAIEQEGDSDMAFVRDLGRQHDAIATWKGGHLLFAPIGASLSAGGEPLDVVTLTKREGWTWRFTRSERDSNDGAEAQWHDRQAGRRRTVSTGGDKPRRLKRIYGSEAEARQAAEAAASRDRRRPYSFSYGLAVADPALQPDQRVTLRGWGETIDSLAWLIKSVETTLGSGGLSQRIEMETGE